MCSKFIGSRCFHNNSEVGGRRGGRKDVLDIGDTFFGHHFDDDDDAAAVADDDDGNAGEELCYRR